MESSFPSFRRTFSTNLDHPRTFSWRSNESGDGRKESFVIWAFLVVRRRAKQTPVMLGGDGAVFVCSFSVGAIFVMCSLEFIKLP